MLQKLYSRLHCLVGLLLLVSLAGCTSVDSDHGASGGIIKSHFTDYSDHTVRSEAARHCSKYNRTLSSVQQTSKGCFGGCGSEYHRFKFKCASTETIARQRRQQQLSHAQTCKGFGFQEGSEGYAQCLLDLFKLEQTRQNQAVQSQRPANDRSSSNDGAAWMALGAMLRTWSGVDNPIYNTPPSIHAPSSSGGISCYPQGGQWFCSGANGLQTNCYEQGGQLFCSGSDGSQLGCYEQGGQYFCN